VKIRFAQNLLEAQLLCGHKLIETELDGAFASDLMSDVLTIGRKNSILLTGLVSPQIITTCVIKGIACVVFVRGKEPTPQIIEKAMEHNIVLLKTKMTMYCGCGILYKSGLTGE